MEYNNLNFSDDTLNPVYSNDEQLNSGSSVSSSNPSSAAISYDSTPTRSFKDNTSTFSTDVSVCDFQSSSCSTSTDMSFHNEPTGTEQEEHNFRSRDNQNSNHANYSNKTGFDNKIGNFDNNDNKRFSESNYFSESKNEVLVNSFSGNKNVQMNKNIDSSYGNVQIGSQNLNSLHQSGHFRKINDEPYNMQPLPPNPMHHSNFDTNNFRSYKENESCSENIDTASNLIPANRNQIIERNGPFYHRSSNFASNQENYSIDPNIIPKYNYNSTLPKLNSTTGTMERSYNNISKPSCVSTPLNESHGGNTNFKNVVQPNSCSQNVFPNTSHYQNTHSNNALFNSNFDYEDQSKSSEENFQGTHLSKFSSNVANSADTKFESVPSKPPRFDISKTSSTSKLEDRIKRDDQFENPNQSETINPSDNSFSPNQIFMPTNRSSKEINSLPISSPSQNNLKVTKEVSQNHRTAETHSPYQGHAQFSKYSFDSKSLNPFSANLETPISTSNSDNHFKNMFISSTTGDFNLEPSKTTNNSEITKQGHQTLSNNNELEPEVIRPNTSSVQTQNFVNEPPLFDYNYSSPENKLQPPASSSGIKNMSKPYNFISLDQSSQNSNITISSNISASSTVEENDQSRVLQSITNQNIDFKTSNPSEVLYNQTPKNLPHVSKIQDHDMCPPLGYNKYPHNLSLGFNPIQSDPITSISHSQNFGPIRTSQSSSFIQNSQLRCVEGIENSDPVASSNSTQNLPNTISSSKLGGSATHNDLFRCVPTFTADQKLIIEQQLQLEQQKKYHSMAQPLVTSLPTPSRFNDPQKPIEELPLSSSVAQINPLVMQEVEEKDNFYQAAQIPEKDHLPIQHPDQTRPHQSVHLAQSNQIAQTSQPLQSIQVPQTDQLPQKVQPQVFSPPFQTMDPQISLFPQTKLGSQTTEPQSIQFSYQAQPPNNIAQLPQITHLQSQAGQLPQTAHSQSIQGSQANQFDQTVQPLKLSQYLQRRDDSQPAQSHLIQAFQTTQPQSVQNSQNDQVPQRVQNSNKAPFPQGTWGSQTSQPQSKQFSQAGQIPQTSQPANIAEFSPERWGTETAQPLANQSSQGGQISQTLQPNNVGQFPRARLGPQITQPHSNQVSHVGPLFQTTQPQSIQVSQASQLHHPTEPSNLTQFSQTGQLPPSAKPQSVSFSQASQILQTVKPNLIQFPQVGLPLQNAQPSNQIYPTSTFSQQSSTANQFPQSTSSRTLQPIPTSQPVFQFPQTFQHPQMTHPPQSVQFHQVTQPSQGSRPNQPPLNGSELQSPNNFLAAAQNENVPAFTSGYKTASYVKSLTTSTVQPPGNNLIQNTAHSVSQQNFYNKTAPPLQRDAHNHNLQQNMVSQNRFPSDQGFPASQLRQNLNYPMPTRQQTHPVADYAHREPNSNKYQEYSHDPSTSNVNAMTNQLGSMSVVKQGYNSLRGIQYIDLLRYKKILPSGRVRPPQISLRTDFAEDINCCPDLVRCTLTKIPESKSLLDKCRLPFGILLHPFRDLSKLSVVQYGTIVRCRSCRTYINPFVYFIDNRHWKCNLCFRNNELPDDFLYNPVTQLHDDPLRRPEIRNATIEFIAPSEYMVRPPQAAAYVFLFDVSNAGVQSGYLKVACDLILKNLERLPGDSRTSVSFITYDSTVHFYNLTENLNQPQQLIISDVDDIFLPLPDDLVVNLQENLEMVKHFLLHLPEKFGPSYNQQSALGPALQAAHKLISATGGRVTVFQSCLPNIGPGALKSREDTGQRTYDKIENLKPATDFYKKLGLEFNGQQIAADFFILNSQYMDLASIGGVCQISGGCMHHFPLFDVTNPSDLRKFTNVVTRYLTRKIGLEAVMRIRCTRGLSIHSFHGNFFVRTTDLLALPNVNPDAGFGLQVSIDENLSDFKTVTFQAALLYTSSKGERRIRVHTLCIPVSGDLQDILVSADQQCIIGLLAKMAVDRSIHTSLLDAREAFVNAAADTLSVFKSIIAQSHSSQGALLASVNLSLIPLYILAILKHVAFRISLYTAIDDRVYAMYQMKCLPLDRLMQSIYPDLYAVHRIIHEEKFEADNKQFVPSLPLLPLSAEHIDSSGIYLLDDGDTLLLYVGQTISPQTSLNFFGTAQYSVINENLTELPVVDSEESELLRIFIEYLQSFKPYALPLSIIKYTSRNRVKFFQKLIEDKTESGVSYYEFLQTIRSKMN